MAAKKDVSAEIIEITPEEAKELLKTQARNRPLRQSKVERYLAQMRNGEWGMNGEAIVVSSTGKLLDGQHRLHAVVLYGKPVEFLVVQGVSDNASKTLDTGVSRTMKDVLFMYAVAETTSEATHLASAVRWKWKKDNGFIDTRWPMEDGRPTEPTPQEALAVVKKHPELLENVRWSIGKHKQLVGYRCGPSAFLLHWFSEIDTSDARTFFSKLISGANLDETDPIHCLRRRLMSSRVNAASAKLSQIDYLAITIKAWNAWREKKPTLNIGWKSTEAFPEPV